MKLFTLSILLIALTGCHHSKSIHFSSTFKDKSTTASHLRGLAVNDTHIVLSGYLGNVNKIHIDSSTHTHYTVDSIEDFRDVHINSDGSLLLINSGKHGKIVKLYPNGKSKLVFNQDNVFLDGISFFYDSETGFEYGDPLDSTFLVLKTINNGETWVKINSEVLPTILPKEAGFAASGTGIQTPEKNVVYIGTGVSETARIFRSFDAGLTWDFINTPMKSGGSFGIYSMYFNSAAEGFIVGGSYEDTKHNTNICFYTNDKGEHWKNSSSGLPGYMSCIHANKAMSLVVTTGRNGTYYSLDKGETWQLLTTTPYYSCLVTDSTLIFSGKNGSFEIMNYTFY